jgi:hypothetical protein
LSAAVQSLDAYESAFPAHFLFLHNGRLALHIIKEPPKYNLTNRCGALRNA